MSTIDWSRFTIRINVNAPVEKLYHGWATRAGIEYWFLRWSEYKNPDGSVKGNEEYVKRGDTYSWRWHGYPDSVTEQGEILEVNGKDFFKFSFGKAGICSVTIKHEQGETIVELVQDQIPTDEQSMQSYHVGCKTGWTFHFANMKSIFEGGIDLRNKNEKLKEVINS
jgi:uncharacterized protein YndB with AHSA1/START domain